MCGIAGLWAPRLTPEERSALVGAMLDRLRHRGPDGTALWDGLAAKACNFFQRRHGFFRRSCSAKRLLA